MEATGLSAMPHGTIAVNPSMSMSTFNATPCSVRRSPSSLRSVRTPTAAIFDGRAVDVGPDARIAVEPVDPTKSALGIEVSHRRDDGVFQSGDVGLAGRGIIGDGDDRPGDDLSGRVVRDVPTAIGVDHDRVQRLRRHQEMFLLRADAARVGRRVFENQDVVVARLQQRALQVVRLREGDPAEVATSQHLALAFDVETAEQLRDALEVPTARDRLTDPVVERESQDDVDVRRPRRCAVVSVVTTGTSRTAPTESTATWGWMMIGSDQSVFALGAPSSVNVPPMRSSVVS